MDVDVNDFICLSNDQINAASSVFCHVTLTVMAKR